MQIINDYLEILAYLGVLGGIANIMSNLIKKRAFGQGVLKIVLFYLVSFVIGGAISGGIYLLCEAVFFLPFYVQIPLSVLCAYFAFDIVFALKHGYELKKSITPFEIQSIDVKISSQGYCLNTTHPIPPSAGLDTIPKGFVSKSFFGTYLLKFIIPSDCTRIFAFIAFDYLHTTTDIDHARKAMLAILLSKGGIVGEIIAFVAYVFVSIKGKL